MIDNNISVPFANTLKCEVCGKSIGYPESLKSKGLGYLVCQSFECQRLMKQKSSMTPALFQSQIKYLNKNQQTRRDREIERNRIVEEMKTNEKLENRKILLSMLEKNPQLDTGNTMVVVIPVGMSTQERLEEDRLKKYEQHLKSIVGQAFSENSDKDFQVKQDISNFEKLVKVERRFRQLPELRALSDKLCGICKGGCCSGGKDEAYLSVITVLRVRREFPLLTKEEILDRYLSCIAEETISGACINQTSTGCALPREFRSDICNGFYCDSLMVYQREAFKKNAAGNVVAIQRKGTCWNRFNPEKSNEVIDVVLLEAENTFVNA